MTCFSIRASRTALANMALAALLALGVWLAGAASPAAQQPASRMTRQIAANDPAPRATLGAPGAALGGPGAGIAPKGDTATTAPAAAPATPDAKAAAAAMTPDPTQAEVNETLLYAHQPPTRVRIAIVNA